MPVRTPVFKTGALAVLPALRKSVMNYTLIDSNLKKKAILTIYLNKGRTKLINAKINTHIKSGRPEKINSNIEFFLNIIIKFNLLL